jgi:hypothetical protein
MQFHRKAEKFDGIGFRFRVQNLSKKETIRLDMRELRV